MESASTATEPITDEWCAHRFDHASPQLALELHETLAYMRDHHPVTHSDRYGGFWVVTRYEDVLRVVQDWQTFSSAEGVGIPATPMVVPAIPELVDPPLHRTYKRLINPFFTPAVVARYEQPTRELVNRLIDAFADGRCDFMADFARPFPGLVFFEFFLNAPVDEIAAINEMSTGAATPNNPKARECWEGMFRWITEFVAQRRREPPRGDVVDAVLAAGVDGRPITEPEIIGIIQLLILGGLDTTAGALGQFMIRFCHEPEIPALLRRQPELIVEAIEELLRLEPPFIAIGRTATCDTEIGGQVIKKGEKVLVYWASANRDEAEFACPATFDLARRSNRHVAFGAGPHRCAGSNLARMNLRIALEELVQRFDNFQLQEGVEPIPFHSALNRAPLTVPITFAQRAGAR